MNLINYLNSIVIFLKKYLKKSGRNCFVLGLSGGIDSALTLALLLKAISKKNIYVLILPCESNIQDEKDAINLCKRFKIKYEIIDLTSSYEELKNKIELNQKTKLNQITKNNIKSRLRMITLYSVAQEKNALVVGTSNLDEIYVGYFTKFGDGACDILPLAQLTKGEIYKSAKILGITKAIIHRKPSAGFYNNQLDEEELKLTYRELDNFLLKKKISEKVKKRIKYLHKITQHKRIAIPKPPLYYRK